MWCGVLLCVVCVECVVLCVVCGVFCCHDVSKGDQGHLCLIAALGPMRSLRSNKGMEGKGREGKGEQEKEQG